MATVLIIDDNESLATAVAQLLRRDGHDAIYAAGAGAALAELRHVVPDLILLDLSMPRVDGLDLLDALRDDPQFEKTRVAVYSGRQDPESVQAAERLGACDFILKGPDWDRAYAQIKSHLPATPV